MLNKASPYYFNHTNSDLKNSPVVGGFFNNLKVKIFTSYTLTSRYTSNITYSSRRVYSSTSFSEDQSTVKVEVSYDNVELSKWQTLKDNKGKSGIYRWTNKNKGKCYIDSGVDLSKIFRNYFRKGYLERGVRKLPGINKVLLNANFKLDILEYVSKEKAIEIEQYYMDLINPQYNLLTGSCLGYKHSEEYKLKKSESLRGIIMTDETKLKMSESGIGENMYGKLNKGFLGRTHTEQTREKLSEGECHAEGTKSKISRKLSIPVEVTNLETNTKVIYDTANKAGLSLLCSTSRINSYRISKKIYNNKYLINSVTRNLSKITCRQVSSLYLYLEIVRGKGSPLFMIRIIMNGGIRPNQEGRVALLVKIPRIKAILLEVYLPVVSSRGLQLACDRLGATSPYFELLSGDTVRSQTNCINNFKVESRQSKGIDIQNIGTSRLPKAGNSYGNRGIIVPEYASIYSPVKVGARGRIPYFNIRTLSSSAGSPVQNKSDTSEKLLKLREHCKNNPEGFVNLDKIYRLLYDPMLYDLAYINLISNPGNMTPGITPTTLDGMSMEVIESIIDKLKDGSFKFSPGGTRPLTIAPPRDKLVQEVMRMLLEAIFEPTFSDNSHGFRPNRSCHTALKRIKETFGVASWYIEGDISKCFDCFDQGLLMQIIEKRIRDKRFTDLIRKALKAGYMEFKVFKHSITGTPQGSIISPILSNIYLNELDKFVESLKVEFDSGVKPNINPTYNRLRYLKSKESNPSCSAMREQSRRETQARIHKLLLKTPYYNVLDPSFKKLTYVRYADDWILGVRGSKEDCRVLLDKIKIFLDKYLNLVLSEKKTLITNANEYKSMFLGTEIFRLRHQYFSSSQFGFNGKEVRLEAPKQKILNKLTNVGFLDNNEPVPRFLWLHNDKDTIISLYNSVYHGYINYYCFAENLSRISSLIHFILKTSCAKLLAAKYKLETQSKVFAKYGRNLKGEDRIGFAEAVYGMNAWDFKIKSKENIPTLYAETLSKASILNLKCAICESDYRVKMHHIRMMRDLNPKLSKIDALMAKRNRKQIPLCRKCHYELAPRSP